MLISLIFDIVIQKVSVQIITSIVVFIMFIYIRDQNQETK